MVSFFRTDKDKKDTQIKRSHRLIPLLPLRDIIVFPYMVTPLFVGRERSINALEYALNHEKDIFLSAQRRAKTNDPSQDDIYEIGTLAQIVQLLKLPDGTVKVLVEGKRRGKIRRFVQTSAFYQVEVDELSEGGESTVEIEALMRNIQASLDTYVKLNRKIPPEMLSSLVSIDDPARLVYTVASQLNIRMLEKQALLEADSVTQRLEKLYELMQAEIEILQIEKKIRTRVKKQMERSQKEYYLNEQMQAIQRELGERDEFKTEIQELEEKVKKKKLSKEAAERVKKEIKKLKMMSPMSAEATVVRNYIDWILALPWGEITEDKTDIEEAERVLDEDHYGLKKPKERILEYLAVHALVGKLKGPILCFVGPPGVGKTSLGRSIARAINRKFVRISLGGVRDEAEIRGHRRTYIGALPGKIIQSMKKAGSSNPVFLLDEVDKMSSDFRGDPASALLEVLDPEQNNTFNDHYIDLDYDLSHVMFITTANTLPAIPIPLQDRMEIIRLPGYSEYEKLSIASKFLVSKQMEANGIKDLDVNFSEGSIRTIINRYTREAGVRSLEREIASICRKIAKKVVKESPGLKVRITDPSVSKYLGPEKFTHGQVEERDEIGLAIGLAWTESGGDILGTECTVMPGKGKLIITGKLGEVMQESAQAALSYVRDRASQLGLPPDFYQKADIHVHVPEGAIPKDGPSAGITMATAMVSALCKIPVRRDVAMTGEITLRGRILPIGGLKEKILAAHRGSMTKVLIPKENEKDLHEIPQRVLNALQISVVEHMDQVLRQALQLDNFESFLSRFTNGEEAVMPQGDVAELSDPEPDGPGKGEPVDRPATPGM